MSVLGLDELFSFKTPNLFHQIPTTPLCLYTTTLTLGFVALLSAVLFGYVLSTLQTSKLSSTAEAIQTNKTPPSTKSSNGNSRKLVGVPRLFSAEGADRAKSDFSESQCSSLDYSKNNNIKAFRRSTTSIGRFALRSQTKHNPCIVTFFVAVSNRKGQKQISFDEFAQMWDNRVMRRHERFRSHVLPQDDRYFEVDDCYDMDTYIKEPPHPKDSELSSRITNFLTSDIDVSKQLWEAQISTGPVGASGAVRKELADEIKEEFDRETVAVFRIHHTLCDGVSLSVAVGDACDEGEQLREAMMNTYNKIQAKKKLMSVPQKFHAFLELLVYYVVGGIIALSLQFWRLLVGVNPFDQIMAASKLPANLRSTTWRHWDETSTMKKVAKSISSSSTINDICVACITAAIRRQLEEHMVVTKEEGSIHPLCIPSHLNITVPVHLTGGVLLPGQTIGNKIGAFVTAIPLNGGSQAKRLRAVSKALMEGKRTPAALISWYMAKFFSLYAPLQVTKFCMRRANARSVAVISNVKGFPFRTHWNGRRIEHLSAMLPLPPGIPMGFVVQSYNGDMSMSVEADKRAVPDAVKFADWAMEEYNRLKTEAFRCMGK